MTPSDTRTERDDLEDWQHYDTWLLPPGSPGSTNGDRVFHSGRDCKQVHKPDRLVERDEQYMEVHEPTPCQWCHDDLSVTQTDSSEWRTPLRNKVSND